MRNVEAPSAVPPGYRTVCSILSCSIQDRNIVSSPFTWFDQLLRHQVTQPDIVSWDEAPQIGVIPILQRVAVIATSRSADMVSTYSNTILIHLLDTGIRGHIGHASYEFPFRCGWNSIEFGSILQVYSAGTLLYCALWILHHIPHAPRLPK